MKGALTDASCKTVWLNGNLLYDQQSILKHLTFHFGSEFLTFEQFGEFLEQSKTPIIFILEEIDQFAIMPGQHLLYTLFEAASNLKLPVLIVGLTERYDFVSMLEKRVKSRFSQYIVSATIKPVTFETYLNGIISALSEGQTDAYRKSVIALVNDQEVSHVLNHCYLETPTLHHGLNRLCSLIPLDLKSSRNKIRHAETKRDTINALSPEPTALKTILSRATEPMLILLISLCNLERKCEGAIRPSFEMVLQEWNESRDQLNKSMLAQAFVVSKENLYLAWEELVNCGFLVKNGNSTWIDPAIEQYYLAEPLTNLYEGLPPSCPEHLRRLDIS